jgi:hypothetical protein
MVTVERLHTRKDAEYCIWYIKKKISSKAVLIGSFGKGSESSMNDIDIYIEIDKNDINKQVLLELLDAKSVDDTDWGGWFFHGTIFGNVDIFFDISEFNY